MTFIFKSYFPTFIHFQITVSVPGNKTNDAEKTEEMETENGPESLVKVHLRRWKKEYLTSFQQRVKNSVTMTPKYKVRENNKSPFSYSFTSQYASHLRYFSYDLAIFLSFSPFSFYETARLFKNSSFFKIGAFIIAFKRNINSRIYPTEKCREKDGVIRHLDALIWPTLSKRFAFALYQP